MERINILNYISPSECYKWDINYIKYLDTFQDAYSKCETKYASDFIKDYMLHLVSKITLKFFNTYSYNSANNQEASNLKKKLKEEINCLSRDIIVTENNKNINKDIYNIIYMCLENNCNRIVGKLLIRLRKDNMIKLGNKIIIKHIINESIIDETQKEELIKELYK